MNETLDTTVIGQGEATSSRQQRRRRLMKRIRRGALAAIGVFIAGAIAVRLLFPPPETHPKTFVQPPPVANGYNVQQFADLGRLHLGEGERFEGYNSSPPTSGSHAPRWAEWGRHTEPVPREQLVHNMEHGGVVVWYNCGAPPALTGAECHALADQIWSVAERFYDDEDLVVVTPSDEPRSRIALTAWTLLDEFDTFDAARVTSFLETYIRRFNPEGF